MEDKSVSVHSWKDCLPEILLMVFQHLDAKSLIKCMLVSEKWRNIAETICQKIGWETIAEQGLYNNGVYLLSTGLDWRGKIVNWCLWSFYELHGCKQTKLHEYEVSSHIRHSYVYKDDMVILDGTAVTYYNVRNYKVTRRKIMECQHYEENEHIALTLTYAGLGRKLVLYLHSKACDGTCELHLQTSRCTVAIESTVSWQAFHLTQNICYLLQANGELQAHKWDGQDWDKTAQARYYGIPDNIQALHKYRNILYALSQSGGLWHVNPALMQVKKVCSLNLPQRMSVKLKMALFHYLCSVIYEYGVIAVDILEDFYKKLSLNTSCAKFYGGIIFLGEFDGKVKAYTPTYLADSDIFDLRVFEICNVLHFLSDPKQDPAVVDLNIYEDHNSHHLFIYTKKNICQVKLEPRNNVFNYDN